MRHWCKTDAPNYLEKLRLRFEQKFVKRAPGQCWIWHGSSIPQGYGQIKIENKNVLAHRVALLLAGIDVPGTQDVLHTCDNPKCVNPAHLTIGSHKDNMEDKAKKGRAPCRLTTDQVVKIKAALAMGASCNSLSIKYGVVPHTIRDIRDGVTWIHV